MKKIFLLIGGILGILVFVALVCSASTSSMFNNGSRVLEAQALVKSMEVLDHQVSVIDKLTNILTWQNVIFGIGGLLVLVIAFLIVRASTNKFQSAPQVIQLQAPAQQYNDFLPGGSPRFVVFGPAGDRFLLNLPPDQQAYILEDLKAKVAILENENRPRLFGGSRSIVKWR